MTAPKTLIWKIVRQFSISAILISGPRHEEAQIQIVFPEASTIRGLIQTLAMISLCFFAEDVFSQQTINKNIEESYFFYSKKYPNQAANSWANDKWAPNGITHDDKNWYICSVSKGLDGLLPCKVNNKNYTIWKIPVTTDLNQNFDNTGTTVIKWELEKFNNPPDKNFKNYGHAGDLDRFVFDNVDYLAVPLTGGGTPIVAFFRAHDLRFINYVKLNNLATQSIGWCAVHPISKQLYTSLDNATTLYSYTINWSNILKLSSTNHSVSSITPYPLTPLSGSGLFENMQGGEFTPTGNLLYISCGLNGSPKSTDGIHVFEPTNTNGWREIKRSTNSVLHPNTSGSCFDFTFDNKGYLDQEPEGLTIWDLDNKGQQNVRGTQLHVLVDDHNCFGSEANTKVFLHHYKRLQCPNDLTVYGTSAIGEPATNSTIANFLNRNWDIGNCGTVSTVHPPIFGPGENIVTFKASVDATTTIQCVSKVKVVAKYDECSGAMPLSSCKNIETDNYCASLSVNMPYITGYTGGIKDVWFKIDAPTSSNTNSLSIETYQLTGGLTHTVMQVLSGTCGQLKEIGSDDGSSNGGHAKVTITNHRGSNPIYVRVSHYGGNNYGKFGIYYQKIAPGSNIFTSAEFISGDGSGLHQYTTLTGDVNGDGKTDLIFPFYDPTLGTIVRTKMSNGDGTFKYYADTLGDGNGIFQYPTLTGDVNGDRKTDLIFPFYDARLGTIVRTRISNGNGTFKYYADTLGDGNGIFQRPTLTGDINGDGKTDLIFPFYDTRFGAIIRTSMSNGNGTYKYYADTLGDGNGIFQRPTLTGDVNGDGKTDLIFPFFDTRLGTIVRTRMSNGNGKYKYYADTLGDGNGIFQYQTLIGDVNGDGKTDLIFPVYDTRLGTIIRTRMSNGNGIYKYYADTLGDGNGIFQHPTLTGDVNGDGKTDLIFVGQDWIGCGLNIRAKLSNGNGKWCSDWQVTGDGNGVLSYPVLTGDINSDHKTDLISTFVSDANGLMIRTKIANSNYSCNLQNSNVVTGNLQASSDYLIYPNPASNYFQIRASNPQVVQIKIINAQGIIVKTYSRINTGVDRIDMSLLQNGIYFIELVNITTRERILRKIIKIK